MKNLLKSFVCGEEGFLLSTEGILIGTVAIVGMLVGLVAVRDAVALELQDFGMAVGALNQDYTYVGISDGTTTVVEGSAYDDVTEASDSASINVTTQTGAGEATS